MKSSRANELLKDQPGFYLIRYSESEFLLGNYAISVNKGKKDEDDIKHFTTQNLISEPGFMFNSNISNFFFFIFSNIFFFFFFF